MGGKQKKVILRDAKTFNYWLSHSDFIVVDRERSSNEFRSKDSKAKKLSLQEMANLRVVPAEKKCRKCGKVKPSEAFGKNARNKDGLQSHCKECYLKTAQAKRNEIKETISRFKKTN